MCSEIVIEARGVAKAYLVYPTPADRLRQAIMPRLHRALGPLRSGENEPRYFSEHWALRALNFQIQRGETVAVIGRNGSGKSTLLQLICGTLSPTSGTVHTSGRIGALLELGSGFNPEYTGLENIILNASVLGLTRQETEARLDKILAFADIGEFVTQPVKTYSSGMVMRLAFAVIAHVDADILVIDEALSVGDAYFQQKCMRWLRHFQARGTVLFCGHDIAAVTNLCDRALWLDRGVLRMEGTARRVAEAYNSFIAAEVMGLPPEVVRVATGPSSSEVAKMPSALRKNAGWQRIAHGSEYGSGLGRITHLRLLTNDGREVKVAEGGQELILELRIEVQALVDAPLVGFTLKNRLGETILGGNTADEPLDRRTPIPGGNVVCARMRFMLPTLQGGTYVLAVAFASGTQDNHMTHHWVHEASQLTILSRREVGALILAPFMETSIQLADPLDP